MTTAEMLRLYHAAADLTDEGEHCLRCGVLIGAHTEGERDTCARAAGLGPWLDGNP